MDLFSSQRIAELEKLIVRYQTSYYNGEGEISDAEFDALWDELKALAQSNSCFKTYWVHSITNGTPLAFSIYDFKMACFSSSVPIMTLAHELGHLLGLDDVYDRQKVGGVYRDIPEGSVTAKRFFFSDVDHDWGAETDRGFYTKEDTLSKLIQSTPYSSSLRCLNV